MPDARLCLVRLKLGDTLASLGPEYGLGTGTAGGRAIVAMNGVAFTRQAIDEWVMSTGGVRLPFDAREPFDTARRLGWAVFSDDSRIYLPADGPRGCAVDDEAGASTSSGAGGFLAFLALVGAGIAASRR